MGDLLTLTDKGFYCAAGDFYIDPWRAVPRAVITHAHGDHYAWGCEHYLVAQEGQHVFRVRLGEKANIETLPYGQPTKINGVQVSFHPAGHILGSAQVRVEYRGQVWVVSGDYKVELDRTAAPFEPVRCHMFITEATFALPIYRWRPQAEVFAQINAWWRKNQAAGKPSLIYGYALGKAQRIIAGVDASIGPIFTHGAVERLNSAYRDSGIDLPETTYVRRGEKYDWSQGLIVAPPSAASSPWTRKFTGYSSAFASGWMRIRGTRRRRAMDRGFVLSDHADWDGLLQSIAATGAERIGVTHGYVPVLVRYLRENGIDAVGYNTRYTGEIESEGVDANAEDEGIIDEGINIDSGDGEVPEADDEINIDNIDSGDAEEDA